MTTAEEAGSVRLNKFIATHLGVGRRYADELIGQGKVTINGQAPILGARVQPNKDIVMVRGKKLDKHTSYTYIALHKPVGYVCSRRQQDNTPTIYSLLPAALRQLKPVGRLDKDSSGIILLTNDGDFAHSMTHPKFIKVKQYEVTLDKPLEPLHHQMIADHGVILTDGPSRLGLERIAADGTSWKVTMHEGRNRQIRRTFAALGYTVTRLHRTQFGAFALGDLASGTYKQISPQALDT